MKLLPRLAMVLAICLIATAPLTVTAQARCRYPEIRLSTNEGVPGDSVTVSGWDFDPDEYVDVYYYLDSTSRIPIKEDILPHYHTGNFDFVFTIPECPAGKYRILAESASDSEEAIITVKPGLRVSPSSGSIGSEVAVQGWGFGANETDIEVRYYFGRILGPYERVAKDIAADATGSWEAIFQVPDVAGGEYEISARGSETLLPQAIRTAVFRVGPGISIGEPSGAVGESIPMSGRGFFANEPGIRILVDGKIVATAPADIRADDSGAWEATFEVPEMPAGEYSITAEGDYTRQRDIGEVAFEIRSGLAVSPGEGHVGMNLTAAGQGFPNGNGVVILYNGSQVATAEIDDEGSFAASFSVPESRHGQQQVAAAITDGTNSIADLEVTATAYFMMESDPPPTPELISPTDGHRAGILRSVRPTFDWSEVFDDSGVYYDLRVATSTDFTPDSIIVSVTGLTETSYTPAEALPEGTYYWIVQAVDGAENESGWSEAYSFRVGLLPRWGLIAAIVAAVLLFLLLIRVLVRRSIYYDRW